MELYSDEYFMQEALKEAKKAFDADEVPVGVVIVADNKIIARTHNLTERLIDVTAHAEMQAITSAANFIGGKYLNDCTLYVTLEPCLMCAGALYWSHLTRLVYGARDDKKGFSTLSETVLHPKTVVVKGILEQECGGVLKEFFQKKRK
jgi:tRNA(adenine34) deaminase